MCVHAYLHFLFYQLSLWVRLVLVYRSLGCASLPMVSFLYRKGIYGHQHHPVWLLIYWTQWCTHDWHSDALIKLHPVPHPYVQHTCSMNCMIRKSLFEAVGVH